jgi:protein required for attachment to host cells
MKTRVLVASAARARMFDVNGRREPLVVVKELANPEHRLQAQALKSDKPGRAFDRTGGQRHAVGTSVDPKEQIAIRFAKQVMEQLETDRHRSRFDSLCVVAPPHFMGLLREHMGSSLTQMVRGEVINDLTQQETDSVREHVAHLL